jgi:hypothetical protein
LAVRRCYAPDKRQEDAMSKLHLVFGGRVRDPRTLDFDDLDSIDMVGLFPDYKSAEEAWRAAAQRTVDDAEMRYVVVHLHRLLEPDLLSPPKE